MEPTKTWGEMSVAFSGSAVLLGGFGIVYSMGVLYPEISADIGIPVWHLAAYFSTAGAIYFGIGTISGMLADRFGARGVICAGQMVLACGLAIASIAHTEPLLAVGYVAGVGVGIGLIYVPVVGAVQVLCLKRSVLAAGIAATGIGVGSLLLPPVVALASQLFDWRIALQWMAGAVVMTSVATVPLRKPAANLAVPSRPFRPGSRFAILYIAQLSAAVVAFVPFAHLVNLALANGLSLSEGVALLSSVGIGSIAGRLGMGVITARIGVYHTGAICSAGMATAMIALSLSHELRYMEAAMLAFGAAYGGFNALLGPITVETCGRANIGRALGTLVTSRAIGMLFGPWLVGFGAWTLGSYTAPLIWCACFAAISALLLAGLDVPSVGVRVARSVGSQRAIIGKAAVAHRSIAR